jgi:acyl-CoA synthetase (AMP-forming)/AMP-acid ligase II
MTMDVRGLMRRSAQFNAGREAIAQGGRSLTYAEAWRRGIQVANGLLDLGLKSGDRVGVLEDNTLEAQDVFAGAAAANLVRVPLYARNSPESHGHMLEHTGCRALIVSESHAASVEGLRDSLPDLEHVLVRDSSYESWLAAQSDVDPDPEISPEDYFIIRHSGGTTGRPKGVAYTHRSWLATGRDWFYNFPPVQLGDTCLHLGPISHGSGYLYTPIWLSGGRNVLLSEFDPELVLDAMEQEQVAYAFMVPTMLNLIVRHPSAAGRDWSKLKVIQLGGSPVADATALLARDVFGEVLYQGYGQTEALPVCMMGPKEWFSDIPGSTPLRSAGRPLPFAELEIRDDNNQSLPIGEEGEIAIRCEGQMTGFWEDEALTKERLIDGWVLTGDIGRFDANGFVYVLDRKDDMIISGGFNIWPAELENVILDHPDVVEVAVVGIPHQRWGEAPLAIVVVRAGVTLTAATIQSLCSDRLGSYKKPSNVEFRSEPLPKSPVGKIQRKVLRAPFWADSDRKVAG